MWGLRSGGERAALVQVHEHERGRSALRRDGRGVCGRSVLIGMIVTALPAVSTASPAVGAGLDVYGQSVVLLK